MKKKRKKKLNLKKQLWLSPLKRRLKPRRLPRLKEKRLKPPKLNQTRERQPPKLSLRRENLMPRQLKRKLIKNNRRNNLP